MLLVVYFHGKSVRNNVSNQLKWRYIRALISNSATADQREHRGEQTHPYYTIVWLSYLACIIWSNHLKDYVFIITYLSKLHSNFSELQYPYGNFFCFFYFFSFSLSLNLFQNIANIERYAVACAQTVDTAATMKNEWQRKSVV